MLTLEPIGTVRSPFREPADAPRQPHAAAGVIGAIDLVAGRHLEDALHDIDSWEYLWVLFWFHRATAYRPKVLPPRSSKRRGVLATRSPHRPNPLGLSVVKLTAVRGLTLEIADVDMLDGTPVLDIKPYLPWADVAPTTGTGWVEPITNDPEPGFAVRWDDMAKEQLAFLETLGVHALREAVEQRLALGPQPHAYRRIRIDGDARELAYKAWRFRFDVDGRDLHVQRIASGYRPRELATNEDPSLEPHRLFAARFGVAGR